MTSRSNLSARSDRLTDPLVFAEVYESTHRMIFRYVYALHGGPQEMVEDLTAEVFVRAWKARRRFRGDRNGAVAWLFRIARNLVIDTRRRRQLPTLPQDLDAYDTPDPEAGPESQLLHGERDRILLHMLDTLPDDRREMLVLRYVMGWPVKRIAAFLDIQENTATVRIRRALQRLRRDWPQDHVD